MLTAAVLLFVADRLGSEAPFRLPEMALLILLLLFPAIMAYADAHVPVSSLALGLRAIAFGGERTGRGVG
jgi:hypothetical protein